MIKAFVVAVLLCVMMSQATLALSCKPGTYEGVAFGSPACMPCTAGFYCPNGVVTERCPFNTVSFGSADACTECADNANRGTDPDHVACLLADVPKDVVQFNSKLVLQSSDPVSVYTTLRYENYLYIMLRIKQVNNVDPTVKNLIKVYASRTFANPGPSQYERYSNSKEPVMLLPYTSSFDNVYLTIIGAPDTTLTVEMSLMQKRQY